MIDIHPIRGFRDGKLPLGEYAAFRLYRRHDDLELRWFLGFGQIFHTKPMCDWGRPEEIEVLPEGPGSYRLAVQWRRGEASGWEIFPFEVLPSGYELEPSRGSRGRREKLWAPNSFEAKGVSRYESALHQALPRLIEPGSVVYDVGANIGLYSVPMARATGREGRVYCFEPNPVCVSYLHVNLVANGCTQCEIVPLALGDRGPNVSLTVNFANSLVGVIEKSPLYGTKPGQEIVVQAGTLDAVVKFFPIPAPDVVKVDVEGAEAAVIRGMEGLVRDRRPLLLLEIHGGTAAFEVSEVLDRYAYSYEDAESGALYPDRDTLMAAFEGVRQLICRADPPSSGAEPRSRTASTATTR
ncbi:MAG: FkbM family methyltransferase [Holophagales bacterium]|nr:FkbM family methyltransferase [Holophagales bacterium]